MVSVERILGYTQLEPEEEQGKAGKKQTKTVPPENWPQEGRIVFRNVNLYYDRNQPPVLKDINFEIEPSEKVCVLIWQNAVSNPANLILVR